MHRDSRCIKCAKTTISYNELYDSYYCYTCDEWKEKQCKDGNCGFCTKRPKVPSEVINGT